MIQSTGVVGMNRRETGRKSAVSNSPRKVPVLNFLHVRNSTTNAFLKMQPFKICNQSNNVSPRNCQQS